MRNLNIRRNYIVDIQNPIPDDADTHAMKGRHFGVVCQNDKGNIHSDSIIVCYITSQVKRLDLSTNVVLQWYDCLFKPSMIKCSQLMTVDKKDILSVVGELRDEDVIRFNQALAASLALDDDFGDDDPFDECPF